MGKCQGVRYLMTMQPSIALATRQLPKKSHGLPGLNRGHESGLECLLSKHTLGSARYCVCMCVCVCVCVCVVEGGAGRGVGGGGGGG